MLHGNLIAQLPKFRCCKAFSSFNTIIDHFMFTLNTCCFAMFIEHIQIGLQPFCGNILDQCSTTLIDGNDSFSSASFFWQHSFECCSSISLNLANAFSFIPHSIGSRIFFFFIHVGNWKVLFVFGIFRIKAYNINDRIQFDLAFMLMVILLRLCIFFIEEVVEMASFVIFWQCGF